MTSRRSRRVAASSVRSSISGFSAEERKVIPQLLELLRSGALASLLPPAASPVRITDALPVSSEVSVSSDTRRKSSAKPKTDSPSVPMPDVGWNPIKRKQEVVQNTKDKLIPGGWSVPVKNCLSELSSSEAGVCLVTASEARRAITELKGEKPLAILSPSNIDGRGMEIHVLVEDPSGRWQTRRRFLLQLGVGEVNYMDGAPKKLSKRIL